MVLPLIILVYFIIHYSEYPDCISLYFKNEPVSKVKRIAWPDNGLLTLWFDSTFFANNSDAILALMNKYQFSGVISLSKDKSCRAQSLTIHQLILLRKQGWEITETKIPHEKAGEYAINDMPAQNLRHQVIYDIAEDGAEIMLPKYLQKTQQNNGWIILYFHTIIDAKQAPQSLLEILRKKLGTARSPLLQSSFPHVGNSENQSGNALDDESMNNAKLNHILFLT
jgi:hypothetical protein